MEFWIGLPADQEPRGTTQRMPAPHLETTPFMLAGPDRESLTAQAFLLNPHGQSLIDAVYDCPCA